MVKIKQRSVKLTDEQKARHAEIRRQIERDNAAISREALEHKAQLDALIEACAMLKTERQRRGLSLSEVSRRSGIDPSRLSKLENDPAPNPTLTTLLRLADAIGVRLTLGITDKAA